ncbi:uncharacterized protein J4E78_010088 [Alternaria triticimaculans]|uniref:uncharacterized protein n=1 Tax=Alternaria triticimaculans TaxID=297637 RepID=UPI0020C217E0|nr:uncharacterized protein J4E78_010088 [Alternaria triticimaculans]KAI4642757.1 hypothetical protein J4E78_010088 [Alternaria triticimaculans]
MIGQRRSAHAEPADMALPARSTNMYNRRYINTARSDYKTLNLKPETTRPYQSGDPSVQSAPEVPGTMKIIVGPESNQRTWHIPKARLIRHSSMFDGIIAADRKISEVQLPTITPNAFADFVPYMESSVYSPNTVVTGYRSLRAHAEACLLGVKLEASEYWEAGMRELYELVKPLARSTRSDAKQSLLRASDIAYICANTTAESLRRIAIIGPVARRPSVGSPPPPRQDRHSQASAGMELLQRLFFDALASHWSQRDVHYIGAQDSPRGGGFNRNDVPGDSTTWGELCETYPDFKTHMNNTGDMQSRYRGSILSDVNTYLGLPVKPNPQDEDKSEGNSSRSSATVVQTEDVDDPVEEEKTRPKLTLKLRGLRRRGSRVFGEELSGNVWEEHQNRTRLGESADEEDSIDDAAEETATQETTEGVDAARDESTQSDETAEDLNAARDEASRREETTEDMDAANDEASQTDVTIGGLDNGFEEDFLTGFRGSSERS